MNRFANNNDEIEVRRRRQGSSQGPRGRAEAPKRRKSGASDGGGGGGFRPSSSSGSGGSGGGMRLPWWAVILLVIGFGLYSLFSGGDSAPQTEQPSFGQEEEPWGLEQPTERPAALLPTRTPAPRRTLAAAAPGSGQTWTVMLYQDADDKILEEDIMFDLNEAERIGSSERVNIVSQMDRYPGGYSADGDWASTRRYYVTRDNDLNNLGSELVQELGEIDMAEGESLVDFAVWAIENYPADKYVLILSDHGMGWPGGWSDASSNARDPSRAPIASALGNNLFLNEIDQSLGEIRQRTGVDAFEIVGMDACLMGHLEVFTALQPHARFAIASQETEPGLGWSYTGFLDQLIQNPDMDGAELSRHVLDGYIVDDQRIVDDQARANFVRQGSPLGWFYDQRLVSASQLAQQLSRDVTLTAADLGAIPLLNQEINDLTVALQDEDQSKLAKARSYAQSFTNIFEKGQSGPYIDLANFVRLLKKTNLSPDAAQAADRVLAAIQQVVVAEMHGTGKPGAEGVSIYFPNSTLYRSPVAGPQSYTIVADRFARESLWDDFLAYHYHDIPIDAGGRAGVIPGAGVEGRAPGAGNIEVSAITLSSQVAAPNQPVRMSAEINGTNIGYIYLFVGYFDPSSNSIFVADTDYLESPDTREENGVFYPQWNDNQSFTMTLEWEPTVFQISDGDTAAVALFTPQQYGATASEAVYTVDGVYVFADSGDVRSARLYFRDGMLYQVFGFTGSDEVGAPWEIKPQPGDTFTIQETWMDLDTSGRVAQTTTQEGVTLTVSGQAFEMTEVYAAEGNYVVGFIVEDLDGNTDQVYTQVTVR